MAEKRGDWWRFRPSTRRVEAPGGMAEWLNAPVLKTGGRKARGFESHSLRFVFHPSEIDVESGRWSPEDRRLFLSRIDSPLSPGRSAERGLSAPDVSSGGRHIHRSPGRV